MTFRMTLDYTEYGTFRSLQCGHKSGTDFIPYLKSKLQVWAIVHYLDGQEIYLSILSAPIHLPKENIPTNLYSISLSQITCKHVKASL